MSYDGVRRILHCDMDCFFAAVHMRDDPALRGRPVVVGGDPEGRGVVAAASYEARLFGVRSAMPARTARHRCPEAVFLTPDFGRYKKESERILEIFRRFTPTIQPLSLDEAFLDVTETVGGAGSATAIAKAIRSTVQAERGLVVSVGVAPNKLVAKIASDHDKPDGLTVVRPERVETFLAPLPVRRLHGVGPSSEARLHRLGVHTVADLRALPLEELEVRFGSWGRSLWESARGIDHRPVKTTRTRKSLSSEHTFRSDLRTAEEIDEALKAIARDVAGSLARRNLAGRTITLKVRYPDFTTPTRARTLNRPVNDEATLVEVARSLLTRTEAHRRSVRLLGLGVSGFDGPTEESQLRLF
jgi:DNA polymerase-4